MGNNLLDIYTKKHHDSCNYEFFSGNLNAIEFKQFNLFDLLIRNTFLIVSLVFPLRSWLILTRSFLRSLASSNTVHREAKADTAILTIGDDIFFGNFFSSKPQYSVLSIYGGRKIKLNQRIPEIYISSKWILYYFFTVPFVFFKEVLIMQKISNKYKEKELRYLFMYEVLKDLSHGTYIHSKILFHAIDRFFRMNQNIEYIILPFEGRNWEKKIIAIANQAKIKSIAYIHSSITSCHQGIFRVKKSKDEVVPDIIITPGKFFTDALIKNGWDKSKVVTGFYLRDKKFDFQNLKTPKVVFSLTGNYDLSSEILKKIKNIRDKNKILSIGLNKRAASYSRLKSFLIRNNLKEWDGKINPKTLVITSSFTFLIESRHKGINSILFSPKRSNCSAFELAENDKLLSNCIFLDELKQSNILEIYNDYYPSDKAYLDISHYLNFLLGDFNKLENLVNKVKQSV